MQTHTARLAHIFPPKTSRGSFATFLQNTNYTFSPTVLLYCCSSNQLCQLILLLHLDSLGLTTPSPLSWRGQLGGSVPPQIVCGKDLWEVIGIKRHLLKLALLLLRKAHEIFTREKVYLGSWSFAGIQALKISKFLLIIGFNVHMSSKTMPAVFVKKTNKKKSQFFALPDRNYSILTTWWALGVN